MRIILGVFFLIVSFLGTIFFNKYSDPAISHPILWYILFVLIGVGGLLFFRSSIRKTESIMNEFEKSKIEEIKGNAERIELDFDLCEFKSGTYFHEVKDENLSSLNLLAPGISFDLTKTERVVNSSLVYSHMISGNTEKYIQAFPFDSTTLKAYILNHKIVLYINRFDRSKYLFEIEN